MKSLQITILKFSTIVWLHCLLLGCGLKYVPTETRESFFQRRQGIIGNYILAQMNGQTLTYTPIAFGKTEVLKPLSYKLLDSLYEQKYQNEGNSFVDKKLEERISNQRLVAVNDTSKVLYVENHVFSLGNTDTVTFYNTLFQLTSDLKITDVKIKQSTYLPAKYSALYRKYLFEESFLSAVNLTNDNELKFYGKYKDELENRSIAQKDAFVLHTLKLMELSAQLRTTSNRELLNKLSDYNLRKFENNPSTIKVLPIKENTLQLENGLTTTSGFSVFLTYTIIENGISSGKMMQFIYNQFLELKEIIKS